MVSVLHITPHLGGGVGSVLLNYINYDLKNSINEHTIATLDYANTNAVEFCKKNNINLLSDTYKNLTDLLDLIKRADITVIHFWNHPLLYDFLIRNDLPDCRLIFWAHVSGFIAPYVFPEKITDMADKFIFTTPISYNVKEVLDYPDKSKFSAILSTSGVEKYLNIHTKPHKNFNIGYIGTVDYVKMHPQFLKICKNINLPNVEFTVIGGDNENKLRQECIINSVNNVNILGKIDNIEPYLSIFDIFAYPLNPNHYGTAEQVLQEAMAAGIVPVVFNNPSESFLVKHLETGLTARNITEYCEYIKLLYKNEPLRKQLSANCKTYAKKHFSLASLAEEWNSVFSNILNKPKTQKSYKRTTGKNYSFFDIFLESLGTHNEPFVLYLNNNNSSILAETLKKAEWQSYSKGTIKHYNKFFEDKTIKKIMELYNE